MSKIVKITIWNLDSYVKQLQLLEQKSFLLVIIWAHPPNLNMPLAWLIMASMINILLYTYSLKEVAKNTLTSNPIENWKVPLPSWLEIKVELQFSPKIFFIRPRFFTQWVGPGEGGGGGRVGVRMEEPGILSSWSGIDFWTYQLVLILGTSIKFSYPLGLGVGDL